MRCQRCQFENMPGQSKCFRCGSILESTAAIQDVHPPRMKRWKRPLRSMARWARQNRILHSRAPAERRSSRIKMDSVDYTCIWGLFLSIIPGLAHLVDRRFREIRWYFIGWLLALSIGLLLYGTFIGLCLVGLAIGLHAWIAVQHILMKQLKGLGERLGMVIIILIILVLAYSFAPRLILQGLTSGYTALTLPYQNVQRGDYLLAWRDNVSDHPLPRGSIVRSRLAAMGVRRRSLLRSGAGDNMFVQIVGHPGESIQVNHDVYIIDGRPLDGEKYPVPQWLQEREFLITIPTDSYFVSTEYNLRVHGRGRITKEHIRGACLISFETVQAKAFMRWLPLLRRGFIEEIE